MRISRLDELMVGGLAEGLCGAVERSDAERGQLLTLYRQRSDGSDWLSWGDLVPHDHILRLNLAHAIGQVDCVPFFDSLQCVLAAEPLFFCCRPVVAAEVLIHSGEAAGTPPQWPGWSPECGWRSAARRTGKVLGEALVIQD